MENNSCIFCKYISRINYLNSRYGITFYIQRYTFTFYLGISFLVFPVSGDVLLGVALPLETLELPDGVAPEAVASEVVALEVVVLALPAATFAV